MTSKQQSTTDRTDDQRATNAINRAVKAVPLALIFALITFMALNAGDRTTAMLAGLSLAVSIFAMAYWTWQYLGYASGSGQ